MSLRTEQKNELTNIIISNAFEVTALILRGKYLEAMEVLETSRVSINRLIILESLPEKPEEK